MAAATEIPFFGEKWPVAKKKREERRGFYFHLMRGRERRKIKKERKKDSRAQTGLTLSLFLFSQKCSFYGQFFPSKKGVKRVSGRRSTLFLPREIKKGGNETLPAEARLNWTGLGQIRKGREGRGGDAAQKNLLFADFRSFFCQKRNLFIRAGIKALKKSGSRGAVTGQTGMQTDTVRSGQLRPSFPMTPGHKCTQSWLQCGPQAKPSPKQAEGFKLGIIFFP